MPSTICSRQSAFVTSNQNAARRSLQPAVRRSTTRRTRSWARTAAHPAAAISDRERGSWMRQTARVGAGAPAAGTRRTARGTGSSPGGCRTPRRTPRRRSPGASSSVGGERVQREQTHGDQRQVQRVDLGDDGLGPERVRERQQQTRRRAGQRRLGEPAADGTASSPTAAAAQMAENRFSPRAGIARR